MKIGILQTGRSPDELRDKHGDYNDLFMVLLKDRDFSFKTFPVLDGVFPDDPGAADGWLITGSRFGAYEDHDWIAPLEDFLRKAFEADVPIVGICFGHQILAQALGGKVEKFKGGWSIGPVEYRMKGEAKPLRFNAFHQDQIVELPRGASVTGNSDFCKYAMLAYGDKAMSIQPHPEFETEFLSDLVDIRRNILPADIADSAQERSGLPLDNQHYADLITEFFMKGRG